MFAIVYYDSGKGGGHLDFFVTFLEGVISFISPCTLPLLPVYLTYLTGGSEKRSGKITRPLGFVLGFTVVFTLLGLFAGALSRLLVQHQTIVNIVSGVIVILFGLSYLDIIHLPFFKGTAKKREVNSFFSALLFGMIYSVTLTPCVGAFLGSAIMLASSSGTAVRGTLLLLTYSLGMGIPFLLSAVLIERLTGAIKWIKQHYKVINKVCGGFLIVIGVLMACGMMSKLVALLS